MKKFKVTHTAINYVIADSEEEAKDLCTRRLEKDVILYGAEAISNAVELAGDDAPAFNEYINDEERN